MISCGVCSSWPSQKGHRPPAAGPGSPRGLIGRLARSVAMMTQRPTIGSLRSSGIGRPRPPTRRGEKVEQGEVVGFKQRSAGGRDKAGIALLFDVLGEGLQFGSE